MGILLVRAPPRKRFPGRVAQVVEPVLVPLGGAR